jgi:hypothetical protein
VYAVGAVGYYLLTGTPVFTGTTVIEICMKHAKNAPEPPSVRSGRPVSSDLEELLLRCLAKSPADRPRDAAALLDDLDACSIQGAWTASEAAAWWAGREQEKAAKAVSATVEQAPMRQRPTPDVTLNYEGDTRKT